MSKVLVAVLVVMAMAVSIECLPSRNLDESLPPPAPGSEIKCSICSSCNNPCNQLPPPPPASPPPPKKPKTPYCPPPPPSPYLYIIGAPGELYPIDQSVGNRNFVVGMPVLVGVWIVGLIGVLEIVRG